MSYTEDVTSSFVYRITSWYIHVRRKLLNHQHLIAWSSHINFRHAAQQEDCGSAWWSCCSFLTDKHRPEGEAARSNHTQDSAWREYIRVWRIFLPGVWPVYEGRDQPSTTSCWLVTAQSRKIWLLGFPHCWNWVCDYTPCPIPRGRVQSIPFTGGRYPSVSF